MVRIYGLVFESAEQPLLPLTAVGGSRHVKLVCWDRSHQASEENTVNVFFDRGHDEDMVKLLPCSYE